MATNPFSQASNAAINELGNIASAALPTIALAILLLVAAIVGFWFIAKLFGFDVGLSETAKERIRTKAAKRNAAFPFAFSKRSAKVAAEGGPWQKPNSFQDEYNKQAAYNFDDLETSYNFFANMMSPDENFVSHIKESIKHRVGVTDRDLSYTEFMRGAESLIKERSESVYDAWEYNFSHLPSIRGLSESNLDLKTKATLMMHASRILHYKMQVMAENNMQWEAHYADGDDQTNFKFVA